MLNSSEDSAILGFHISFEPRRVYIEFRTDTQAVEYLRQIQQRSVYKYNALEGERNGKICSLRLPSRITSVNVWGSEIYLTFGDKTFASDWVNGLLIWGFRKNQDGTKSETDVCLRSATTNKQLNKALRIPENRGAGGFAVSQQSTTTDRRPPQKLPRVAMASATE
jgi:hypothetical protein